MGLFFCAPKYDNIQAQSDEVDPLLRSVTGIAEPEPPQFEDPEEGEDSPDEDLKTEEEDEFFSPEQQFSEPSAPQDLFTSEDVEDAPPATEIKEELLKKVKEAETDDTTLSFADLGTVERIIAPELEIARREETALALSKDCGGTLGESGTINHIMGALAGGMGKEAVFFDSAKCPSLPNSLMNLSVALGDESQRLDVRLESLADVGVADEDEKLVTVDALNQGQHSEVVVNLREKLAAAHGVHPDEIEIQGFYEGSFGILYTVRNLKNSAVSRVQELNTKLRSQFNTFLEAKVHPLFYRTYFDVSMFFPSQNKDFSNENSTYEIGPPGDTRTYRQPHGWYRYGLNVLGKYADGDEWLHPFQNPKMWYKAFHGTKQAKKHHFGSNQHLIGDDMDAQVNAIGNIIEGGFIESGNVPNTTAAYGSGVYCVPDVDFNSDYWGNVSIETTNGKKRFHFVIMCAVRPGSFTVAPNGRYWVVQKKVDIRPYGLLVKPC